MKFSKISLAKPDDPIFKRGPIFYQRPSGRLSEAELATLEAETEALKRRRRRSKAEK